MKPLVSVIIPTFNRIEMLKRAIESVLKQTYRNFELIVVDDGSTDGTEEYLKQTNPPSPSPLPSGERVTVRGIHQPNRGVSSARNVGIKQAKGEFIAFLDSDDEWLPKKLERQVEFFKKNPEALICQTEEIWIRNGRRANPMRKHKKHSGWIFKECLPLCIVSPSAVMMKRELFDRVSCFDESLPACEDYDLWLRVAAQFPIYLLGEPLIIKYGGHADQLSRTVPSLDRYRIQALEKLLTPTTGKKGTKKGDRYCNSYLSPFLTPVLFLLTQEQRELAFKELKRKCKIYGNGCLKHGKEKEGQEILDLPNLSRSSLRRSEATEAIHRTIKM